MASKNLVICLCLALTLTSPEHQLLVSAWLTTPTGTSPLHFTTVKSQLSFPTSQACTRIYNLKDHGRLEGMSYSRRKIESMDFGDSQDSTSLLRRRKKKRVLASIMSLIFCRFFFPHQAHASTKGGQVDIDTTTKVMKQNPSISISVIATGAVVGGGFVLTRKQKKENQEDIEEKKKKFEEIIGVQTKNTRILKTLERKQIEPVRDKKIINAEVPKNVNGDHSFKPPLAPAKSKTAAKQEVKMQSDSMKAKAVARTILEATERSKKSQQVNDDMEDRKANFKASRVAKVLSEAKSQREKRIIKDIQEIQPELSRGIIESSDRYDKSKEKVFYSLEESQDLEEHAFKILLDLGLVKISRDPESDDYDHSDDNDIAN